MPYLDIESMDGRTETILVNDSIGAIRVREGQLIVVGGDRSFTALGGTARLPDAQRQAVVDQLAQKGSFSEQKINAGSSPSWRVEVFSEVRQE